MFLEVLDSIYKRQKHFQTPQSHNWGGGGGCTKPNDAQTAGKIHLGKFPARQSLALKLFSFALKEQRPILTAGTGAKPVMGRHRENLKLKKVSLLSMK